MSDLLDIRFEKDPTLVGREVAGEFILVSTAERLSGKGPDLYTLDAVAAFLWGRLDGKATGRDLIASLREVYEVDPGRAEKDTRVFLEQLKEIEAIRPV